MAHDMNSAAPSAISPALNDFSLPDCVLFESSVNVSIHSTIQTCEVSTDPLAKDRSRDFGEPEHIRSFCRGTLTRFNDRTIFRYNEDPATSGMEGEMMLVWWDRDPTRIHLRRNGTSSFSVFLDLNAPRQTMTYESPYGTIYACASLHNLENKVNKDGYGKLTFTYTMEFPNGAVSTPAQRNTLEITLTRPLVGSVQMGMQTNMPQSPKLDQMSRALRQASDEVLPYHSDTAKSPAPVQDEDEDPDGEEDAPEEGEIDMQQAFRSLLAERLSEGESLSPRAALRKLREMDSEEREAVLKEVFSRLLIDAMAENLPLPERIELDESEILLSIEEDEEEDEDEKA